MRIILSLLLLTFTFYPTKGQTVPKVVSHKTITSDDVKMGAEQFSQYEKLLQNKRVGVIANQTSMVKNQHLVDFLIEKKINVVKVFSPEHGFRGAADAGAKVNSEVDSKTGLPIVSLYGNNKKPTAEQLKDIDVLVFDLQDVGTRFYTYISTMTLAMEACAEQNKPIIVLDRPNPNGHFIDGPILDKKFSSFVGMHPIPVAHGMTVGEYAKMVNGEKWLTNGVTANLTVIPCKNYDHDMLYQLPVWPSPNLNTMQAIYLYPTLCFFEGTSFSVGRGTERPFTMIGHPKFDGNYEFTPKSMPGATKPVLENQLCKGFDLYSFGTSYLKDYGQIYIFWLIDCYERFPEKDKFFNNFFDKLAGTDELRKQIIAGKDENEIRASWEKGLKDFQKTRVKYLLYEDFKH